MAARLRAHADELRQLQGVEEREGDVPLHARARGVLGRQAPDRLHLQAARRGEACYASFAELDGEDGGAVAARADGLGVGDIVREADGDAVVELRLLPKWAITAMQSGWG